MIITSYFLEILAFKTITPKKVNHSTYAHATFLLFLYVILVSAVILHLVKT